MWVVKIIYYAIVALTLVCGCGVVLFRHALYAALSLVFTMLGIAALFVMINAQIAAAFQVIVYAGAIMVLFLFVIMLLNIGSEGAPSAQNKIVRSIAWVGTVALFVQMLIAIIYALCRNTLQEASPYSMIASNAVETNDIARFTIMNYIYAFEMISVLLLIGVVGAVVLARRKAEPEDILHVD